MPQSETTQLLAKHGKIVRPMKSLWDRFRLTVINGSTNKTLGGMHFDDLGNMAFWLALLFVTCNIVVFAIIMFVTTQNTMNKKFLSLTEVTTGATCVEVPQQINGMFQGDTNGYWETNDMFNATRSLFQLQFSGRGVNNKQFEEAMQGSLCEWLSTAMYP